MGTPGLADIKKELKHLQNKELIALILELSKFSTDNKYFLYFQLFGRDNPQFLLEWVKEDLEWEFQKSSTSNYHTAKKSAQGIRKKLNKYLKYTKNKLIQVELIEYFCRMLHEYGYLHFGHPVIDNLYLMQIGRIERLLKSLHEDLQFDYQPKMDELKSFIL